MYDTLDRQREMESEFFGHTLADQHRDWHAVNGWSTACPLDCFDPPEYEPESPEEIRSRIVADVARRGIPCGHCHNRHESVTAVAGCRVRLMTQAVKVTR